MGQIVRINADGLHYRDLNEQIHRELKAGHRRFVLENVRGQRYIGAGLPEGVEITIKGVAGNDLGAFMNGARVVVEGNAQDGVGNTMNDGRIVVKGDAGDIAGYAMRGGQIFIKGNVGYRTGIHMKAYEDHFPFVVVGGVAQDYLGEYMAGGYLVVLNLAGAPRAVGYFTGTGMHGGQILIRGKVEDFQVGKEVGFAEVDEAEWPMIKRMLEEFFSECGVKPLELNPGEFIKLYPKSTRPYGNLYSY